MAMTPKEKAETIAKLTEEVAALAVSVANAIARRSQAEQELRGFKKQHQAAKDRLLAAHTG